MSDTETKRKLNSLTLNERAAIAQMVNDLGEGGGPWITTANLEYVPWPHLIECVDLAIGFVESMGLPEGSFDERRRQVIMSAICKVAHQRTDTPPAYWSAAQGRYVLITE